tara:strand:- start:1191 stop:1565 length:375 start_codon:yes stop_codon:yes gene_type:complete
MTTKKFEIVPQPMDGNCFYHSVCYLLKYYNINEITHEELRNKVVVYLKKKRKNTQQIKRVQTLSEWAQDEDVLSTAKALKVCIVVWEGVNKMWVAFGDSKKKKIYIINKNNIHFDAIIPENKSV